VEPISMKFMAQTLLQRFGFRRVTMLQLITVYFLPSLFTPNTVAGDGQVYFSSAACRAHWLPVHALAYSQKYRRQAQQRHRVFQRDSAFVQFGAVYIAALHKAAQHIEGVSTIEIDYFQYVYVAMAFTMLLSRCLLRV
jgi:hypothetical protein